MKRPQLLPCWPESEKEGREPKVHGHKTARTLKEQQEYLISAIPSVGPTVAKNLLKHFGSVEKIMTASSGAAARGGKGGAKDRAADSRAGGRGV